MEEVEGVYTIDKPYGMSSQRAVQIVKRWARERSGNKKIKVGHAGTLDPLATGVLVVAIGRAYTKRIDMIVGAEKEYEAHIFLGMTSTTDDAEGDKIIGNDTLRPSRDDIIHALHRFIGDITQVPPQYSAIKIDGKEAYKRVRKGEMVNMQPRIVHIRSIDLMHYTYPIVTIRVICGKGTYIRSLARDIGVALGTGAYMSDLVRTRIGEFVRADAKHAEDFGYIQHI